MLMLLSMSEAVVASSADQDRARALRSAGTIVPLEQIIDQVRARRIERILEVELESNDTGHYYEIEALDDQGRVRKLEYDATTGRLIKEQDDD
jgi:uncharacterized membrane protein YkoI